MVIITDITKLIIPCEEWNFSLPPKEAREFAKELIDVMYKNNGMGLAANQIGRLARVFAMPGSDRDYCCFNPIITSYSNEVVEMEEGCLSFPNLLLEINRAKHCTLSFQDYNGDRSEHTFTGMTARVIQHEMEHLDGELFFQGVNRIRLEKAIKEAKKRGTDYSKMGLLKYCKKEKY